MLSCVSLAVTGGLRATDLITTAGDSISVWLQHAVLILRLFLSPSTLHIRHVDLEDGVFDGSDSFYFAGYHVFVRVIHATVIMYLRGRYIFV